MADVLPNCRAKTERGRVFRGLVPWVKIYCANCGCDGGMVPEHSYDFAFYLCDPCAAKWEPLAGTMMIPDEAFWEKVAAAELETYGRHLSELEIIEELKKSDSVLTKLARDRAAFNKE